MALRLSSFSTLAAPAKLKSRRIRSRTGVAFSFFLLCFLSTSRMKFDTKRRQTQALIIAFFWHFEVQEADSGTLESGVKVVRGLSGW
jgi:hypothetical protein